MATGATYHHGGYSVYIAPDGAITVKAGDQISHYSMAKYHDFKNMDIRFGRKVNGKVKAFKEIPGADIRKISVGETVYDIETHKKGGWDTEPSTPKESALALIDQFEKRTSTPAFVHFKRQDIAAQLRDRVNDPKKIGQDSAGVCGPTALVYNLAKDEPVIYVTLVIDLFENGRARIGNLDVKPSQSLLTYKPLGVQGADWIPEASLRNSEDWNNLYPLFHSWTGRFQWAGPSSPLAIAQWFSKVGYTDAKWGLLGGAGPAIGKVELMMLSGFIRQNYRVVLLINHELENLTQSRLARAYPDHYVGLTAEISFSPNPNDPTPNGGLLDADDYINMKIFSHRHEYNVGTSARHQTRPQPLSVKDVYNYLWGYAAGRY